MSKDQSDFWYFVNEKLFIIFFVFCGVVTAAASGVYASIIDAKRNASVVEQVEGLPNRTDELAKLIEQYNTLSENDPLRTTLRASISKISEEIAESE